ncbi:thiamine phosphate synthase [Xanthomonas albilineans]|uniref:thiamine phosphate synthase n=1 Tax=Xanthomonas albilineans TaxID=29447 RepID=UPI0005F30BB4|nr:thiamine phosphate synthase [Xanthomonas albilineans]
MNASTTPRGVYLITPDETDGTRLLERVAPLLEQGVTWLQYRNKHADAAQRLAQASALHAMCLRAGVPLIVNDDVTLAQTVGAAGVHLGEDDGDLSRARATLGPHALIGASCYDDLQRARAAAMAGASYVAFGAFFPSRSKVATRRADPGLLRDAAALRLPRVAIGGLTPDNARAVVAAGADLLAVISGVFDADNPRAALAAYRACFA